MEEFEKNKKLNSELEKIIGNQIFIGDSYQSFILSSYNSSIILIDGNKFKIKFKEVSEDNI